MPTKTKAENVAMVAALRKILNELRDQFVSGRTTGAHRLRKRAEKKGW